MSGPLRRIADRDMDALITAAPTDVAVHRLVDLLVGRRRHFCQQRRRLHDLAGLAVAALRHTDIAPCHLHGVLALGVETLDGDARFAGDARHGDRAGAHGLAVEVNRAGAAQRDAAAELRPGQAELVAQVPHERHRRVAVETARLSIHTYADHASLRWRFFWNHAAPPSAAVTSPEFGARSVDNAISDDLGRLVFCRSRIVAVGNQKYLPPTSGCDANKPPGVGKTHRRRRLALRLPTAQRVGRRFAWKINRAPIDMVRYAWDTDLQAAVKAPRHENFTSEHLHFGASVVATAPPPRNSARQASEARRALVRRSRNGSTDRRAGRDKRSNRREGEMNDRRAWRTRYLPISLILMSVATSGFAPSPAFAAPDCCALAGMKIKNANLFSATGVAASGDLPAYCRVLGYVRPAINFEIRLPLRDWNGKLYMTGCGGFCGTLNSDAPGFTNAMNFGLRRGYAVSTSDSGHWGTSVIDGRWAMNNPVAQMDWGQRSVGETARVAKFIIKSYYGAAQKKAYFAGCSTGGRMGAME